METNIRVHARRLHNALRHAIEDGDGRGDLLTWVKEERPPFEHHACGMYLINILAVLEGEFGERCWNEPGVNFHTLEQFVQNEGSKPRYRQLAISTGKLDALHEIRNAVVHNNGSLDQNRNEGASTMVRNADLIGVEISHPGAEVTLISNRNVDFMEFVRVSYLCVTQYHGKW